MEPKTLYFVLVFFCISAATFGQELITYPAPKTVVYSMHNDDYTVKVRKPGGALQDLFEYNVKVDMDKAQDASPALYRPKLPRAKKARGN